MRLSNFQKGNKVLLVGEGNFSFAVSLAEHNLPIAITASCYEPSVVQDLTRRNVDFLQNCGVRVLLGIDATNISENQFLSDEKFDVIIFNFPHVGGKMRLDKNRELLRNFFASVTNSLETEGKILVTLCNGQGGTTNDEPARNWNDSWKIREMAAHGNFILTRVEPFDFAKFTNYVSTGYRGLEKEFHMINSWIHIFVRVGEPSIEDLAPEIKFSSLEFGPKTEIRYIDILPEKHSHSLCPPIFQFDLTYIITIKFSKIDLYAVLYNFAGNIVRNVEFVRSYKFPDDRITETHRLTYQSNDLPLYRKRVIEIHHQVIANILEDNLNVIIAR